MNFDDLVDDSAGGDTPGATPQGSGQQPAPMPSFDELTDDREQQAQAPGQAPTSFDDLQDDRAGAPPDTQSASGGEWSAPGAAAAGLAKGAIPTTAGLAAGLYAGAAASPFVTPIGGALVGLGVGALTSWISGMGQDALLAAMGFDKPFNEAEQQHPYAFMAGEAGPAAALLKPTGSLMQRGIGAAIGGGAELVNETLQGEGYDPGKLGIAAGAGAALPSANRFGSKILAAGDKVPGRYRGGNNPNPDLKEIPLEPGQAPDITINDGPEAPGSSTPTPDQMEASVMPANVGRGTAEVKPPPAEIPGVGNPEGAPMLARTGARPSEPGRNYAKDTNTAGVSDGGVVHNDSSVAPDTAAAMKEAPEQVQEPGQQATAPEAGRTPEAPQSPEPAPTIPERVQSPEPRENVPERVQTGLTPDEIRVAAQARSALRKLGYDRLLDEIDRRGTSAKEIAQKLTQAFNASQSASGTAVGRTAYEGRAGGQIAMESPRQKVSTGVVAASKADAARKEKAIKFAKDQYDEFGPNGKLKGMDPLDPGKLKENRQTIKDTWAEIMKRNGGIDPTVRSKDQYVPLKQGEGHAEAYQWLKALKASATNQNHKNFATIHQAKGMGEVMRETGKVEGDIAHRPQLPEAAEQAETATGERPVERETFEQVPLDPRPGADNSVPKAENELRDWINDLPNGDYETLAANHDIRTELNEPSDPAALMTDMMKTLTEAGRRRITPGKTPKGEITSEVELPAKKVDLPEIKPTARKLDKNSDEFKRLAAKYNQEAAKEPPLSKAEQLARSEAKERSLSEANTRTESRTAIDATNPESVWKAAAESLARAEEVVSDAKTKYGAGNLEMRRRNLLASTALHLWTRFRNPSNPSTPGASAGAKNYAETLSDWFRKLVGDTLHRKLNLQANLHAAIAEGRKLGIDTPYMHRKIALAEQHNRIGGLPQIVRDWYEKYVVPVREQALEMGREMRGLNDQLNLGWDLSDMGKVTTKSYQPRYRVGQQSFDAIDPKEKAKLKLGDNDAFDPFTGRTLSGWAPNLMDRQWYALENGPNRMVFEKLEDGNIRLWRPGMPTIRIKVPSTFEGKIGDVLDLKVKGKPTKFVVDPAATDEISHATGDQVKFHENALWAWTRAADDMSHAVEQTKLYDSIKSSADYKALATTDQKIAKERGYATVPTRMEEFATDGKKKVYLPDNVRWVLDDFHQPGFSGNDELLSKLRNFNTAMLKIFNTNAPLVHVLNEANLFTVGRGFKWLNPKSTYNLAKSIGTAMHSVNSQDALQREMRNAGVNPLLASTKVHGMYGDAAKTMGMEIVRDWRIWDSVFKPWNMTAKEAGDKLYRASSDVTWRLSDYLTTMRYMEERAGGWAPEDAAKRVNAYMSDYQLPQKVLGSRAIQQFIAEQAVTSFGRYKAGVWRSLTNTTKNLIKGDPMLRQQAGKQGFGSAMSELKARQEALGQLMVAGVIATVVGPAMDNMLQNATGDENAKFRGRGVNAIISPMAEMLHGDKSIQSVAAHAWSPGPWITSAMDLYNNKTFSGKEIVPQGQWPGIAPEAAANVAEYGLQTAIPPYATISKTYARPEGSIGGALGNFALEQFGADIGSDAAAKRENSIERVNSRSAKQRFRHPSGMIPDVVNRFTD